jgi:DNA polymerase IV
MPPHRQSGEGRQLMLMPNNNRIIGHIDMDAYFASVEQKCNPLLRGQPIIVTGDGRTVVTTASYEARKYGVKTAMTVPEARRLCPKVIIVRGNQAKYIDTTLRIHKILIEFTDRIESYSIDEFFLDLSDFEDYLSVTRAMKNRIKNEIGITCSIGIAPNKLLAKLASDMHKPDGLTIIKPSEVAGILAKLPIEKLCGIGGKTTVYLNGLGVKTAQDLGRMPLSALKDHFGICAQQMKNMGQGIDTAPVKMCWEIEPAKSIGHSYTLPIDTFDLQIVNSYLLMQCEKVSTRLRKANLMGRTVSLVLRFSDFSTFVKQKSIELYIKMADDIFNVAGAILKGFCPFPKAVRMVGVSISNLSPDYGQAALFETIRKKDKLADVVMGLNDKYGEFTVKPASLLLAENLGTRDRCALIGKYLLNKHA